MVADVLQFPKVVGGNHRRHPPALHLAGKNTLDPLSHHRIKTVKGLVAEQILGIAAYSADQGKLLLHSLGIGVDLSFFVQSEIHQIIIVIHRCKIRVHTA